MKRTTITTKSEIIVVYFTDGRVRDIPVVKQVGKELREAVPQAVHKKLLLSFRNVTYLPSIMISELIALKKACDAAKVELKFCDIRPNILEVFNITKLHKLIDIQTTEDRALKRFGKKRFLSLPRFGA
jgi:anti-sigma B factor antagonist